MTVQDPSCHLCGQIAGEPARDLIAQFLPSSPYVRRVVLDTEYFAAVPSLGPLADGHVLLCPRAHLRSTAALPEHVHAEYEAVRAALIDRLMTAYDTPVHVFEHGMAEGSGRTACTVEHAHVHLVPLPRGCGVDLAGTDWQEFDGRLDSLAELTDGREYIMYSPSPGRALVCVAREEPFESQYMRRVIARSLGLITWDWRAVPDAESAHRTWLACATPLTGLLAT